MGGNNEQTRQWLELRFVDEVESSMTKMLEGRMFGMRLNPRLDAAGAPKGI